jgi:DNA-binding transcriptional regulator YhcF (GntR family)
MPENLLLRALPPLEKRRLSPFLKSVDLPLDHCLIDPEAPLKYVWFPHDAIASAVQSMVDGSIIEVGMTGFEGMIGISAWLGVKTTSLRCFVQVPGQASRMRVDLFRREVCEQPSPLNGLIAHYIHSYIVIAAQKAACNCLHDVNQRLCRWLSMMAERLPEKDMFPFRQEFLAYMLGVHRPTVSIAAEELQRQGLIRYSRGHLRILDREGLRARSCECYEVIARQLRQMLAANSNSEHAELSPSFEIRLHRDGCGHPE